MKLLRALAVFAFIAVIAGVDLPVSGAQQNLTLNAEAEAFALRIEYDLPLPADSGTIPDVIGEIRRESGDNSKGLAAAPSNFAAVTAGAIYDPYSSYNGNNGPLHVGSTQTGISPPVPPQNRLPVTECFYPGQGSDTVVRYPTDIRQETAALPPVSYANAQCSPGPVTQLTAWAASADSPGYATEPIGSVVHTGNVSGDALIRPNQGRLESSARASAEAVKILDGAIRIGSIESEGASSADGPGGRAATTGHIALSNITAGGQTFSIANDEIAVGGQSFPTGSDQGHAFIDSVNQTLAPTGCNLSILGPADRYPQGYLLSRKPPELGLHTDGTFAASMHGGLLVLCDLPQSVTQPTTFNPQRVQILLGFEYTMTRAVVAPEGFGLGDLGALPSVAHQIRSTTTVVSPVKTVAAGETVQPAAPATATQAIAPAPQAVASVKPLGRTTRWILMIAGLVLVLLATNVAQRRLRELLA